MLLNRNADLDGAKFTEAWLKAPSEAGPRPAGLIRHVHNQVAAPDLPIENAPPAPFDAVDELWFDDQASADAFFSSQYYQEAWLGPRGQLLAIPPQAIAGTPKLVWERPGARPSKPIKLIVLPVRKTGMNFDAFVEYWTVTHASLALNGPLTRERLRRLEACPQNARLPQGLARAPFDGVGAIQFDTLEDLNLEFSSDYYGDHLAPDEPRFTDPARSRGLMAEEILVFERNQGGEAGACESSLSKIHRVALSEGSLVRRAPNA